MQTVKSFVVPPVTSFSPKEPSGMLEIAWRKKFFSGVNGRVNNGSQAGCYRDSSVWGAHGRRVLLYNCSVGKVGTINR